MKCAVSDFDRTLYVEGRVSERNIRAVRQWQRDGNLFFIATGRNRASIEEQLEPFGQGNEKPQFAQKNLLIRSSRVLGRNRNAVKLSLVTEQGYSMEGMLFTEGDRFMEELGSQKHIDVIYYPDVNEYNGNRTLQIVVREYKLHP